MVYQTWQTYPASQSANHPAPTTLVVFIYEPQNNDITGMNKEMQNASAETLKHILNYKYTYKVLCILEVELSISRRE